MRSTLKILFAGRKELRKSIGLYTKKRDQELRFANNKQQLIKELNKSNPDIVLWEDEISKSGSLKVLELVKKHNSNIVFIVLAEYSDTSRIVELMLNGADNYILISKLKTLPKAIKQVLLRRKGKKSKNELYERRKLKQSEDTIVKLLERVTDAFIALDKDFCYTYLNPRTEALIGRKAEDLIGKNVWDIFPDAVGSDTHKAFMKAMNEQVYVSNTDYYPPLELWQENYIYPSPEGLSVFIKDVSDRKKLEKKLWEQQKEYHHRITAAALEAQEKERTFIGKELHDNVNQIIVGTRMLLKQVNNDIQQVHLLDICIESLDKAIHENRKLAHELVTPDLAKEQLSDKINDLVQPMLEANGIITEIDISELNEKLLDKDRKLNVYRIVQEQCTNILKYAKAKKAIFRLVTRDNIFKMMIKDDGMGANKLSVKKGIGLKNIEGRVEIFNGKIDINTEPGKGFQIDICLPIDEKMAIA